MLQFRTSALPLASVPIILSIHYPFPLVVTLTICHDAIARRSIAP